VDPRLSFVILVVGYLMSGPAMWIRTRKAAA
jgi:hypothetical protein